MDEMTGWVVVKGAAVVLGAMAVGAVAALALNRFWNSIANWLNNVAADAVERALGYNARKHMEKAVACVTRLHDRINNKTTVYIRQRTLDTHIQKVSLKASAPAYEQEEAVIQAIDEEGELIKKLEYHG